MARYGGGAGYRGGRSGKGRASGGGHLGYSASRSSYGAGRSYSGSTRGSGWSGGRSATPGSAAGRGNSSDAGRIGRNSYSSNTKSFVAGKIAGQYQAKGYSKAHAQSIGNKVVGRMAGTFQSGSGSPRSWTAGVVAGRNQGLYGYGLSRSTHIGNTVVRKQLARSNSAGAATSSGGATKVVNKIARSKRSLPTRTGYRMLRQISKIRFQQEPLSVSVVRPIRGALSPSRSKILGLTRVTSAHPPAAAPLMKIRGWAETLDGPPPATQPPASKIARWLAATRPSSKSPVAQEQLPPSTRPSRWVD